MDGTQTDFVKTGVPAKTVRWLCNPVSAVRRIGITDSLTGLLLTRLFAYTAHMDGLRWLLPEGCEAVGPFDPLLHFVSATTQQLVLLGAGVLVLGYAACGLVWVFRGPDGQRQALRWARTITLAGVLLVMSPELAKFIITSFTPVPCMEG